MLLIWIKKILFFSFLSLFSVCRVSNSVSNHVFPDIRFLNMKFWLYQIQWKCDRSSPLQAVCANSDNRINKIVRDKIWWWRKTILIWLPLLMIYRHGPLLKIVSKIYLIILVKRSGWTKYDLTIRLERTICGCGPRLIIVSNNQQVCWFDRIRLQ